MMHEENPHTLRQTVLEKAFSDEQALLLRKRIHDEYSDPKVDLPRWVLGQHQWTGSERVLDLGSGPGTYTDALLEYISPQQYVAADLSTGMLKALSNRMGKVACCATDAERLPFVDESFDVVLTSHTLHYVPHVKLAIEEIYRVLRKPYGVLIASTNSDYNMPEFTTLMQRAVRLLRQSPEDEFRDISVTKNFSLESGPLQLARQFKSVARYDLPGALVFENSEPVVEYIESCRPFNEPLLPEGVEWVDFITIMSDQVRRLVDHFGELIVNKLTGVIIATDEGGFAKEYQERLNR